jgi:NADPH2:quinone reductase
MKTMIMRRTGGPDVLEAVDAARPVPGPGQVLIAARAIGVGWPDILIRKGVYKWMPPLPTSPGSDLTGVIVEIGAGVDGIAVGQPVLLTARDLPVRGGCYAEFVAVPADIVHKLPAEVDFAQAVALMNYQVAAGLLFDAAKGVAAKTVFVTGAAGGVGSALVDMSKALGFQVIGSVSSPEKAAFAREVGIDHAINYRAENVAGRVMELTGGHGVDVVFDHVGGPHFTANLDMLAPFGMLVSFNVFNGMPADDVFAGLRQRVDKSLSVRCFSFHTYDHDAFRRRQLMSDVIAMYAARKIKPRVSTVLPMSAVARAHTMVEAGEGLGKVVLDPGT